MTSLDQLLQHQITVLSPFPFMREKVGLTLIRLLRVCHDRKRNGCLRSRQSIAHGRHSICHQAKS